MADMMLSVADATALACRALEASNVSPANAASTAAALIGAELAGQGGHGLRRVPAYGAQAKAGKVDGHAVPRLHKPRPGLLHVDAGNGFAYPAIDLALAELPAMARAQGIAAAGFRRSHHAGVAGLTVERLADAGLVALFFANAPGAMAPWGGKSPLYGTNPIAFAAPVAGGDPVVVDVSLSKVARGKIMAAEQKGEAIPEGWALDPDGMPTTNATQAMAGTMVPMGDAKGTALALMVELLAAGLTGANYAYEASSLFNDKGPPPGLGHLLIVIDPAAFGAGVTERFAAMIAAIGAQEGTRVPGARRRSIAARIRRDGIEVEAALMAQLESMTTGA